MQLPCPICKGRCGRVWRRDVELVSHAFGGFSTSWMDDCVFVCVESQHVECSLERGVWSQGGSCHAKGHASVS